FLHYTYYHCTKAKDPKCAHKSVSATELDRQIDHYLSRIQISARFKDWALKYLHELHEQESASRNDIIQAQQKAYRDCLGRIDNLVKLKTSPSNAEGGFLSDEEYGRQRADLLKKKAELEELLHDAGHRVDQWIKLSEQTFEFACTARKRFTEGDAGTKKEILLTIGSNLTLKDRTLRIEARKPLFILEKSISDDEQQNGPIEPETVAIPQRQKAPNYHLRTRLLRDLDSNQDTGLQRPMSYR
ncbi:MAG: hypothetical protein QOG91_277, partial [Candidatus Parcubacteria bacterium]|nr:hypothetical protein [Candidatus Parcubacteria bacterium]